MSNKIPGVSEPYLNWPGSPVLYARQVITGFTQGVYQALDNERYRWDSDQTKTRVYISASTPVDAEVFGVRPCIAVSRSGMQFANLGIGGVESVSFKDGTKTRSDLLNGMFVLQHISSKEAEAEEMAFFTAEMIWTHQELLARYGFLQASGLTIEQPAPAGSLVNGDSKGLIAVPVIMGYRALRRSRSLRLGDPILKGITFRIHSELSDIRLSMPPQEIVSGAPEGNDPGNLWRGPRKQEASSQDTTDMPSSTRTMRPEE